MYNKLEVNYLTGKKREIKAPREVSIGTTNTRFYYYPPTMTKDYLDSKNPYTYRIGINYMLGYLKWINLCGENRWLDDWEIDDQYIEHSINLVRELFSSDDIINLSLFVQCNLLMVAKMLGLTDDLDVTPVIASIKKKQLPDGGFLSEKGNYSDIDATWAAVSALSLVGEKPVNVSGVKSFIDSLQQTDESRPNPYEFYSYNWRENSELLPDGAGTKNTLKAYFTLKYLGYKMNNTESLLLKTQRTVDDILAKHSTWDIDKTLSILNFAVGRTYMYGDFGIELRERLLPVALAIYDSLPQNSKWIEIHTADPKGSMFNTFLLQLMILLGRLSPALKLKIEPGSFMKNKQQQDFALVITNNSYIVNTVTAKELALEGGKNSNIELKGFSETTVNLRKNELTKIPFTLTQTSKIKLDEITLKLKTKSFVYDAFFAWREYLEHEGEIEFIITVVG